jgi:hypothetical protein
MLKRDRTSEEKHIDAIMKSGLRRLGDESPNPNRAPNPFPHYVFWDVLGRKGERCQIVKPARLASKVQVRFKDGSVAIVNRRAIRRSD